MRMVVNGIEVSVTKKAIKNILEKANFDAKNAKKIAKIIKNYDII